MPFSPGRRRLRALVHAPIKRADTAQARLGFLPGTGREVGQWSGCHRPFHPRVRPRKLANGKNIVLPNFRIVGIPKTTKHQRAPSEDAQLKADIGHSIPASSQRPLRGPYQRAGKTPSVRANRIERGFTPISAQIRSAPRASVIVCTACLSMPTL